MPSCFGAGVGMIDRDFEAEVSNAREEGGEAKDDNDDADDDVWQEAVASTEQPPVLLVVLMQLGKPYACVVCGGRGVE